MSLGFSPIAGNALATSGGVVATPYAVTGIASTALGTPSASAAASVAGFRSTQVGTPLAALSGQYSVAGIAPTVAFGIPSTPSAIFTVTGVVAAYARNTRVGRPGRLSYNYAPSALNGARVGTPKAKTNRFTCVANGVASTGLGAVTALARVRVEVGAMEGAKIGVPISRYTQFGHPPGICSTRFSQPRLPLPECDTYFFVIRREHRQFVRTQ